MQFFVADFIIIIICTQHFAHFISALLRSLSLLKLKYGMTIRHNRVIYVMNQCAETLVVISVCFLSFIFFFFSIRSRSGKNEKWKIHLHNDIANICIIVCRNVIPCYVSTWAVMKNYFFEILFRFFNQMPSNLFTLGLKRSIRCNWQHKIDLMERMAAKNYNNFTFRHVSIYLYRYIGFMSNVFFFCFQYIRSSNEITKWNKYVEHRVTQLSILSNSPYDISNSQF